MSKHTTPKLRHDQPIQTGHPEQSEHSGYSEHGRSSLTNYIIGYILSVVLTFTAYILVSNQILTGWGLAYAIVGLAIVQLVVQLIYFLHIGREAEPRWNLLLFDFTLVIVVIVVTTLLGLDIIILLLVAKKFHCILKWTK